MAMPHPPSDPQSITDSLVKGDHRTRTTSYYHSHKTSDTVRARLESERRRLNATSPTKIKKTKKKKDGGGGGGGGSVSGVSGDNGSIAAARGDDAKPDMADLDQLTPELTELVSSLQAERALLQSDNTRKQLSADALRVTAIQGHLPNSTSFTLLLSLAGNVAICAAKFYAWSRSGHQAMFSEAVHTLVDVGNQAILAYGLREAAKAPDNRYQYGYGRAAFFYSLLSALSTFGFGAIYTAYQGVDVLMHPPEALVTHSETWAVLALAFAVDGFVLHTAMKDVRKRAERDNITAMQWISKFKDPFTVAVVFEDSAAVVGVLLATGGIGLTHLTGNPVWDGISSICIAALLAGVSLRLIQLNRSFILGKPVDKKTTDGIRKILMRRRSVDAVYAAQTQWVGPSAFAYNAEVDFDGTYLAAQVYSQYEKEISKAAREGTLKDDLKWLLPCFAEDVTRVLEKEVRDIQAEVRGAYREAAFIDIVPDSSQTTKSALESMGGLSRKAEHGVLLALLKTSHTEGGGEAHNANFNLGCAYQAMGHSEKALTPLQSCLRERESLHDDGHIDVLAAVEALASVYYSLGDTDNAKELLSRSIAGLEVALETDDRTGANSGARIGNANGSVYSAGSEYDADDDVAADNGGANPTTGDTYINGLLARAYETQSQLHIDLELPGAAYQSAKSALAARKLAHGNYDPRVATILATLAGLCQQLPQHSHANEEVECLKDAIHILDMQDDPDSLQVARLMARLGVAYIARGSEEDGVELLQEGLVAVKANLPQQSLEVAAIEFDLASAHRLLGNGERAIPLLHSCLSTRAEVLPIGHAHIGNVKNMLIAIYTESGRRIPNSLYEF